MHAAFPEQAEGALYHLTQVTLRPDARVWLSVTGAALSDRAPDQVRRGALVAAALRAAPAMAFLATGVATL